MRRDGLTNGVEVNLRTEVAFGDGPDQLRNIEGAIGTNKDDDLIGDSGRNLLWGLGGDDDVKGGGGPDALNGFAGADTIDPGSGEDERVDGGHDRCPGGGTACADPSADVLTYRSIDGRVDVFVGEKEIEEFASPGASEHRWVDKVRGFEIYAGSRFNDRMFGTSGNDLFDGIQGSDRLEGENGADRLLGGSGNDRLLGGQGDDIIIGGSNDAVTPLGANGDTADFSNAGAIELFVDLASGTAEGQGDDTLEGIENVKASSSSASTNQLAGDANRNVLTGGAGNDRLMGGSGGDILLGLGKDDRLYGDDGDDLMDGASGFDRFFPGAGADNIIGGNGPFGCPDECDLDLGVDFLNYSADPGDATPGTDAPESVTVDLSTGQAQTGAWGADIITEIEDIIGSPFGDMLTGDDRRNSIFGEVGNDSIFGLGENDNLDGGADTDSADGGDGEDFCTAETELNCE